MEYFPEDGRFYVDKSDLCYRCRRLEENVCTLYQFLASGMVLMAFQTVKIKTCHAYDGPGLKVVPGGRD